MKIEHKNILIAPLNWGLGHATRCIPIITALLDQGFTPIIASDGGALAFLQLEFPELSFLELPSYHVSYPKKGTRFRWKMIQNIPRIILAVKKEEQLVKKWIRQHSICGIISDNRFGVYDQSIPSVFITHQLNVLSGFTTCLSTKMHQRIMQKFTETWVPDVADCPNLSGKLGHVSHSNLTLKHVGPLSRFSTHPLEIKNDLLVLLSGPEPQRTLLQEKLISELVAYQGKVVFVKGVVAAQQEVTRQANIVFYNFMQTRELEQTINESALILCRSGYTTVMDLAQLGKKAYFIPTPGQFEQMYLAKKFKKDGIAPFCEQDDFTIEKLQELPKFTGFSAFHPDPNWEQLFRLFQGK